MREIDKVIEDFENSTGCKIIYITEYGSRLYGTNSESSDMDYKGIYIPFVRDVLLKRDIPHWTQNTNNTKEKNTNEDIDLQLFSIYKFIDLLKKGETGALDILFSMFRPETIMYELPEYTSVFRTHQKKFYNKNLHSFVGYCVGQSKKYGIKGARYNELETFYNYVSTLPVTAVESGKRLREFFPQWRQHVKGRQYKYIKIVQAPGPRGSSDQQDLIDYIEVLGAKFSEDVTFAYFLNRLQEQFDQFGNRAKSAAAGVDWKAMSHAVRVITEVEELLDTGFITFPLPNADYIKAVKYDRVPLDEVMEYINQRLDVVNIKLSETSIPEESDTDFTDELILSWINTRN